LHPAKVLLFVQALEFHFREIFLAHCEVFVELGVSDYNAVENFMDKYAIEDDGKLPNVYAKCGAITNPTSEEN
jgi:monomeric isocitrate dehydrogenase